jgi:hypothetical protein
LADDDAGVVQAQQFARGAVEAHQAGSGVDNDQGIGHVGQDGFQLRRAPLQLAVLLLGLVGAGDEHAGLVSQELQRARISVGVDVRRVALDHQQPDDLFADPDGRGDSRLG